MAHKWRNIRRKRNVRIARETLERWLQDVVDETLGPITSLSTLETKLLLYQIEAGISRGGVYRERK